MSNINPHSTVDESVRKSKSALQFGVGYVDSLLGHERGDENKHFVEIQPAGKHSTITAQVSVSVEGDVHIPVNTAENIPVLYAYRQGDVPIVVDLLYDAESDVPEYEAGERRLGHALTDSNIYFNTDGNITVESDGGATVTLQSDGSVSINGGNKGVIYDINTTTDVDGHVTSIDPQRRSDILI